MNWRDIYANQFERKTVLVTGGAGFIGSHLTRALLTLGATVRVLDNFANSTPDTIQTLAGDAIAQLEIIEGSITQPKQLAKAAQGCETIFHHAALGSVPESVEQPEHYHTVNTTGTLNMLEVARTHDIKRVIFASSSSVYGLNPDLPKVESMPASPVSPYAASKAAGESLIHTYAHCYSPDAVSLRYFNVFGPYQRDDSAYSAVIAAFARAMQKNDTPNIFGDGTQSRDFTYVDNVVHANLQAAIYTHRLGGVALNVATGKSITLLELFHAMAQAFNLPFMQPNHAPARLGDVPHSRADLTAIQSMLGYEPIVDFSTGLQQTVSWYATR